MKKFIASLLLIASLIIPFSGCEFLNSQVKSLKGDLIGNSFTYYEYDSFGNPSFVGHGRRINMEGVVITSKEFSSDGGWIKKSELSSVVNIAIDGQEHVACGSAIIFEEDGLSQIEAEIPAVLTSETRGIGSFTAIASWLNSIKNNIGCSKVIIIKSELGTPLAMYQGNSVYWEVADDLPKTTRISIDGKALYIHRVTFDIINADLIN